MACQGAGSNVPKKKGGHVHLLSVASHQTQKYVDVLFKRNQVADTVLDELRSNQSPTVMPLLPVRGENAISEEVLPVLMEGLPFAIVIELSGQDGLDVLRLRCEDETLRANPSLEGVPRGRGAEAIEEPLPKLEALMTDRGRHTSVGKVEAWTGPFSLMASGYDECMQQSPSYQRVGIPQSGVLVRQVWRWHGRL